MKTNLDELEKLHQLYEKDVINEAEYLKQKEYILNGTTESNRSNLLGLEEHTYTMLIHLSVFAGIFNVALAFIAPFILWILNKDKNEVVNQHGKNVLNWLISYCIFMVVGILVFLRSGVHGMFNFGIAPNFNTMLSPMNKLLPLSILMLLNVVFVLLAAIKANRGTEWKYPLAIKFIH